VNVEKSLESYPPKKKNSRLYLGLVSSVGDELHIEQ
jgi:hypothetical protein